ncbi:MAG: hypothetical protein ABR552_01585 [Actinomycetota bacterium]
MDRIWHRRNPDGAATGLEFANARTASFDRILVHAAPERLDVEVRDASGSVVARGSGLTGGESSPIAVLDVSDGDVTRRNIWPDDQDIGMPVILPGGEVGILCAWSNAADRSEWTWRVEFHNHG